MNREEALAQVQSYIRDGVLTQADVQSVLTTSDSAPHDKSQSEVGISSVAIALYALGLIIVLVGIGIVVSDNWSVLGSFGRIGITLGIGVCTLFSGYMYGQKGEFAIAQVLQVLSIGLIPSGIAIALFELGYSAGSGVIATLCIALSLVYATVSYRTYSPLAHLAAIGFGVAAYYALIAEILTTYVRYADELAKISAIICGCALIAIGYHARTFTRTLSLYQAKGLEGVVALTISAGIITTLIPLFMYESGVVDGILLATALGAMYLSASLRSGLALAVSSVMLVAAIISVVGTYFVETFGIALALIVLGFIAIGIGYATVSIYKQKIRTK